MTHPKIYNYHLDLTLDFIKMLFSKKTDTAAICKHTVLKADVGTNREKNTARVLSNLLFLSLLSSGVTPTVRGL